MGDSTDLVLPDSLLLDLTSTGPAGGTWMWDDAPHKIRIKSNRLISHAEPAALACLAAWASHQRDCGKNVEIDPSLQSPYLYKTGLLSALAGRLGTTSALFERALPPTRIANAQEHTALYERITPLLGLQDEKQLGVVLKCVGEILNNVHEHSGSSSGAYVCCSYFPQSDRVSLAVADVGRGVPTDIREKHGMNLSDIHALQAAIQWRVSGASATEDNAGIGLFYARTAATHTGGQFALVSGTAQVRSSAPGDEQTSSILAPWKGTIVTLTFKPSLAHQEWVRTEKLLSTDLNNRKTQPVNWNAPPPNAVQLIVHPTIAGLVEDKGMARRFRDETIMPEIAQQRPVSIDLTKAKLITHSFVHTLLFDAFRRLGNQSQRLLYIQAKEVPVKDMIRIVARYAHESIDD